MAELVEEEKQGRTNMALTITLSDEQLNQAIHYSKTKSIESACNFTQSVASMLEVIDNLQELIQASGYDKVLKKLEDN